MWQNIPTITAFTQQSTLPRAHSVSHIKLNRYTCQNYSVITSRFITSTRFNNTSFMYGISVCQKCLLLNNSEQFPAGRRAAGQERKTPNITHCRGLACTWPDCDEGFTKDFLNAQLLKKTRTLVTSYGKAKVALLLLHPESDTLTNASHLLTARCRNLILKSWGLPSLW